jgi:membrane-associated protein
MSSLSNIIIAFGYVGIFITLFAESGFLLGFFLPGDSLLFTVGLLASQGIFDIRILLPGAIIAAILGDNFGYYIDRPDSLLFKQKYVRDTEAFYLKHGKKMIILARFVPVFRTFAPIFAGVGNMHYRTFVLYNIIGGFLWAGGFLSISYFLGTTIPGIEHYLTYIIIGIVAVSLIPVAIEAWKQYRK